MHATTVDTQKLAKHGKSHSERTKCRLVGLVKSTMQEPQLRRCSRRVQTAKMAEA
jgi:hypothetical protein